MAAHQRVPAAEFDSAGVAGPRIGAMKVRLAIGDFSRMTHLSVKALRDYHDVRLLVPAEIDPASGYRFYEPGQVPIAQVIVARSVAIRPVLTVARRRRVDQARIVHVQGFETDTELVGDPGPERVDDHVGRVGQSDEGLAPAIGFQVEARALRAAAGAVCEPGRRPAIAPDGTDLDHRCAQIAQDLRAAARRTDRRVVQDGDAGKLLVHQFSTGNPRPRRARMFFCTSDVPAPTVSTTL